MTLLTALVFAFCFVIGVAWVNGIANLAVKKARKETIEICKLALASRYDFPICQDLNRRVGRFEKLLKEKNYV